MKHSEIYAVPKGRGQLGLLSVNHEQFRDILAVANQEHFLRIYLFGSYIPIYISKSHELFGTVNDTEPAPPH